jgi:hypothetical protein
LLYLRPELFFDELFLDELFFAEDFFAPDFFEEDFFEAALLRLLRFLLLLLLEDFLVEDLRPEDFFLLLLAFLVAIGVLPPVKFEHCCTNFVASPALRSSGLSQRRDGSVLLN